MKAATAVINRAALIHNYQVLKALSPKSQLMAVVKANGYGHGALEIAKTLPFADYCGVARVDEAIALREAGIKSPILLLEGFVSESCLPLLVEHQLETVIHCQEQLEMLLAFKTNQSIKVWLKLDTGMHRLGIRIEEAEQVFSILSQSPIVAKPINLMTHFACADELDNPLTQQQMARFDAFCQNKTIGKSSLAASGGVLFWPDSRRCLNRTGIVLYGVSPLAERAASEFGLKPVMQLESSLIAVRKHLRGESVGYNATWTCDRDTTIGVVAIGYGDGYSRSLRNGTPVLLNGREVPLVGRVSMDMITVDLGPGATDKVGDTVILWGEQLPIERLALQSGLSPYELMTQLTSRLKLEYVDG